MSFGHRRGSSEIIRGATARSVRAAYDFAATIGRPLSTTFNINWNRTSARDDPDGHLLAAWCKRAARFLRKHGAGKFTRIWVRENPPEVPPKPNAHVNCYIPAELFDGFAKAAPSFLPAGVTCLDAKAILVQRVRDRASDYRRRNKYLLKGTDPKAHDLEELDRGKPQGRIAGKRIGMSEDIGPAARRRHAQAKRSHTSTAPAPAATAVAPAATFSEKIAA